MRKLFAWVSLALLTSACGGSMPGMSIPVKETTQLHSKVSRTYGGVHGLLESVKRDAASIGKVPPEVNLASVDPNKLKKMLMDCFNAPIELVDRAKKDAKATVKGAAAGDQKKASKASNKGVKNAKATVKTVKDCPSRTSNQLADYKKAAPDVTQKFIESKVKLVDKLRKDLLYRLPERAKALPAVALEAVKDAAIYKAQSAAGFRAAQANPLAKDTERKKAQDDHTKVEGKLKEIESVAELIKKDAVGLPGDIASIAAQVKKDLLNFGQ